MIKLTKNFYNKIIIKIAIFFTKYEKINFNTEELNFSLVSFIDQTKIKLVYWNHKEFKSYINDDKSLLFHSFEWLNYAKNLGGANNIKKANNLIEKWLNKNKSINGPLWKLNVVSLRFINIVYSLEYISLLFDLSFKKKIFKFLYLHYLILKSEVKNNFENINILDLKAFFLGACIYKKDLNNSLQFLDIFLLDQVDSLGFHKSYNSLEQSKFINHLHELKNIFLFFNIPENKKLNFQISNMTSVMQNLFHQDKSLILFNGSRNTNLNEVEKVLNLSKDIVPKVIVTNEKGIVFYRDKQKNIFMDIVKPTNQSVNRTIHASTLAFELSCKGEKIITNCGSMNRAIFNDSDYLRYSAAHSTIIVNNTNISELNKNSYRRVPDNITFTKEDEENYILWTASHNGYIKNYKKIITRKIKIIKNKSEIFGEDSIISTKTNNKKLVYHIRFHLMPQCNCIITNNKKNVIIRTNNQSWLFKSSSTISIEDSIFVNKNNQIQQTKQIVITGHIEDRKKIEKWIFSKS
tara:strand:- start:4451 stop:6010 length:1560 start_codon:yes stop_codon:yes gene_type:complete